ncbi:hypothetical protein [Roseomonas elaeocarpi]|uniref:Uncharacterized protein n=1 Tax=Roseomonas elaeocarpi TaxID=907779 RepID=A0ABV6JSZ0_9PROT
MPERLARGEASIIFGAAMTSLLHQNERDRLLQFLRQRMVRDLAVDGLPRPALTRHDARQSSWADDNARAAEILVQPANWTADPLLGQGVLRTLMALGPRERLHRRWSSPRLEIRSEDPHRFDVRTAGGRFTGDLSRGVVIESVRGGEGHDAEAVRHTGNLVEFRIGTRRHLIDVEDTVSDCGIRRAGAEVVLFHESRLSAPVGFLGRGPEREVATIRYEYTLSAETPVVRLAVTLRAAAGVKLNRVRITTAWDELSESTMARTLLVEGQGGITRRDAVSPDGKASRVHEGRFDHLALLGHGGEPELDHLLHLRPRRPELARSVTLQPGSDGRAHWVLIRYGQDALDGGAAFAVMEDRLLLSGSAALPAAQDKALALMQAALVDRDVADGLDPASAEDTGAALNAVATALLFNAAGRYGAAALPRDRVEALRGWYDRQLDAALAEEAGTRSLSFAALSLDAMSRATGEGRYAKRLRDALRMLLGRQAAEGAFAEPGGRAVTLDGHAAAILALARAALRGVDLPDLAGATARAIEALRLAADPALPAAETVAVRFQGADGQRRGDTGLRTDKLALVLRALTAIRLAVAEGVLELPADTRERADLMTARAMVRLRDTLRDRGGAGMEALASPLSDMAEVASQSATILAATAPDEAVASLHALGAAA